jgi:hypothetical protein|eukprot:SAG25_NODE_1033_length_4221_cov_1.963852_3_plen_36_part_00
MYPSPAAVRDGSAQTCFGTSGVMDDVAGAGAGSGA